MRFRSADQVGPQHVGSRVTVRRRLAGGGSSDVLGILEHVGDSEVTVRDKTGEAHVIARTDIVAARVIEPPQPRDQAGPASR